MKCYAKENVLSVKFRVLSIDDDHQNLNMISQALDNRFDVISSSGEESIIELINDSEPDIILLDIMLDKTNGYQLCKTIRSIDKHKRLVIIFVSALDSVKRRIQGYQAGGDDYITKPINIDELIHKLTTYQGLLQYQQTLKAQLKEASLTAITSIEQLNDQNVILSFCQQYYCPNDLDELYQQAKIVTDTFKLHCAMEFRIHNSIQCYPKDQLSKLELEVLRLGQQPQKIMYFGKNILLSTEKCSLLIKNLPIDEPRSSNLKHCLCVFIDILDQQLTNFQQQQRGK